MTPSDPERNLPRTALLRAVVLHSGATPIRAEELSASATTSRAPPYSKRARSEAYLAPDVPLSALARRLEALHVAAHRKFVGTDTAFVLGRRGRRDGPIGPTSCRFRACRSRPHLAWQRLPRTSISGQDLDKVHRGVLCTGPQLSGPTLVKPPRGSPRPSGWNRDGQNESPTG